MILKQIIHYPDTNSIEATWVDANGLVIKCHSYSDVQMDMLRADLGADAAQYTQLIADVEANIQPIPPKTPEQILQEKRDNVNYNWSLLTVTTISGHKFAANEEALRSISFKANNMSDTAIILWEEDWGQFNTNIVELKEALNLAADAHQNIINSVFGV